MVQHKFTRLSDDTGATALIVAVMIVALLAFAAIVVDAGALYAHRRQIQTAADAAALAGIQALPGDPDRAVALAADYAARNAAEADEVVFRVESTKGSNDTLVAELTDPAMGLFFARFMGFDDAAVDAAATAMVGSPITYGSGLMPFGIIAQNTSVAPYGYDPNQVIELTVDNGDAEQGNWHYVDLTPFTDGANNTKTVIGLGGTTDPVSIGDTIYTQTGAPTNPNFNALTSYLHETCDPHPLTDLVYDEDRGVWEPIHAADGTPCNRLITCPVIVVVGPDPYDWDSINGTKATTVVGFLNMFIENDPDSKSGDVLLATFVQVVPEDTLDPGAYTAFAGIVTWLER